MQSWLGYSDDRHNGPCRSAGSREKGDLPDLNADGMGLTYLTQNANKKSVTLNLKTPKGLEIIKRLIASADVFIENFRPGAIARLGLPFDVVREINPKIVYCSISAFGQDGEISHRPAYDHVIQGMCGIMRTTGTPEGGPQKVGAPYIDYATGLNAAFAIVSAFVARDQALRQGDACRCRHARHLNAADGFAGYQPSVVGLDAEADRQRGVEPEPVIRRVRNAGRAADGRSQ